MQYVQHAAVTLMVAKLQTGSQIPDICKASIRPALVCLANDALRRILSRHFRARLQASYPLGRFLKVGAF